MSGCLEQRWVSYAGDEGEAWKCLLLSRALKRSLTTRPLVIIISEAVSRAMGRRLQAEGSQLWWVDPKECEVTGVNFHSYAKVVADGLPGLHKTVFLDNDVLPLKNCDRLFRSHGVQWVGQEEVKLDVDKAVIFVKSRSMIQKDQQLLTNLVVAKKNPGRKLKVVNPSGLILAKLRHAVVMDVKSPHPTALPGKDVRMVTFVHGHPNELQGGLGTKFEKRGLLEAQVLQLAMTLLPEVHTPKLVNGHGPLAPMEEESGLPWELNNSIAIVGMACRYPCANTISEFWDLLAQAKEGIRKVPEGRWTKDKAFIRMDNMSATEAGFLSCPIHTFDAKFFNTNAADMHYLDPQQRLSLRVVWEALESVGIDPNSLKGSLTGVFGGWWRNDYKEMLQMLGIVDTDFLRGYMGNALGPLTARISHFFELIGPSFSTESGCSTSVAGVDMACDSLRSDACDLALAIGANLLLHPFSPTVMEGVLAPDGRCKTYDASADGFGRAEGIGVLILKRFSDAVADGDKIWGCIRGSAVVQEGPSKSMGTPTVDVEAKAMSLALERAGVDPDDVEFVETHGTGTPVGDPIEIAAVAQVYSCGVKGRSNILTIGSVKTNIGHTESVCGIAGIQKSVLSMANEIIPQHLNLNTLNPDVNLDAIPGRLPLQPIPWKRRRGLGSKPRIAGINSFGITGAQAHVVVQEPPEEQFLPPHSFPFVDSREERLLTFSAKTEEAFRFQVEAYAKLLKETRKDMKSLNDLEFTMHTARPHMGLRAMVCGSSHEALLSAMEGIKANPVPNQAPQLCFLFTGQGSQYPGMASDLYSQNIVFRSNFDWANSVLEKEHGFSLKAALWEPASSSLLKSSLYSQTSIFVIELCLLRLWQSWGLKASAVLGHSLGEFAAAVAAGMITPKDALTLVVTRSKLINALPTSSMLVVGVGLDKAMTALDRAFAGTKKWLDIAAVNSESQTVLSGSTELVSEFKLFCDNNEIKTHVLDASHAFHSRFMDPMLAEYGAVAEKMKFKKGKKGVTFVSGVDGGVVTQLDAAYWVRHTRERVRFLEASHTTVREGCGVFLELGPHPVLSALLSTNVDDIADVVALPALRRSHPEWKTSLTSLGALYTLGIPISWENFHRYSGASRIPCSLPGYHFEETPYWMGIKDEGSTPFHPLLGGFIPNPSDLSIFRSTVNVHRLPFLKDHALGDKIIFPCVGYIDMCLTAGYASINCSSGAYTQPTSPISVRSFAIHTPICLSELSPTEFQVVVDKGVGGETQCTIFTRVYLEDGSFKWVRNASGIFSPNPPSPTPIALEPFAPIKARCSELVRSSFDYRELAEFGFNFGPSCQTVEGAYRNPDQSSGEWIFPFICHESDEDQGRFIIHPWLTDPLLQTQIIGLGLLHDGQITKRLVVPVSVDNFTWWGVSKAKSGYVHVKHSASSNEAHLYTEDGQRMVSMLGTEFMETTLANILSLIDSQKNPYPSLAEFNWREKLGPEERRVPAKELGSVALKELTSAGDSTFTPDEALFHSRFNSLAGLYMLKAVKELGLEKVGKAFTWPEVTASLGVTPSLSKFLRYILLELTTDGWLIQGQGKVQELSFTLAKAFPSLDAIRSQITSLSATIKSGGLGLKELECTKQIWNVLGPILSGSTSVLSLVFPEGSGTVGPAEIFYTESLFAAKRYSQNKVETDLLAQLSQLGNKSVVRILEVGSGVGSETKLLLPGMVTAGGGHFHYTYTDLSTAFLSKGEHLFEESGVNAEFAVLDVEKDPSGQGFCPGHYDVIVASWVLHATKVVDGVIKNLGKLLRPGGYLLITELVEPTRAVKLLFGGLEGFWKFQDEDVRPWHCELGVKGWKILLQKNGFESEAMSCYEGANALIVAKKMDVKPKMTSQVAPPSKEILGNSWIVFGTDEVTEQEEKLEAAGAHIIKITRSQVTSSSSMELTISQLLEAAFSDESLRIRGLVYTWGLDPKLTTAQICEPFLYISKYLVKVQGSLRVVAFTRGNISIGPSDYFLQPPVASPLIGMVNVLANENMDLSCKVIDLDPAPTTKNFLGDAFSELWSTDVDVMVAYRGHSRCTPRLRPYKVKTAPLLMPNSSHYKLILPPSLLIQDLKFVPCEREIPGEQECEIQVKAYALNFLDVLMVTKPDPVFEKYNYLGVDLAGVVSAVGPNCTRKVGDRVVIVRRSGAAMPSHFISPDVRTLLIPDDISYLEASTFIMGLLTVTTCLVDVAKAGPGDIVLIHTASGGVGLLGIQMARRLGAQVVVTAGNERKRSYLRDQCGVEHVFNSRSTDYEHDIRKALGGRGVTVVLNSLTSPGFKEATLNLCEKGARFVEMSKMNIWSKDDVSKLRPDVYYEVVDVSTHTDQKLNELAMYLQEQLLRAREDRPNPLPYTRFDASEIREALEYMEKVKHVGKICLRMPEQNSNGEQVFPLFSPDSTYMITGGLGGIGLEVAKWMATVGADTFLLLGRSPPHAEALDKISKLQTAGVRVEVRAVDVGDFSQLEKLMEEFASGHLPPLRGIMHAAGMLDDATYENQSWEKYSAVFSAKVAGAWNLHKISLSLPFPLEHFVLFSSVVASIGAVGQSNYAAGNQYLDCLSGYRNSLGLPSTAINWGQWGGVGLAVHLNVAFTKPLSIHQGTAALCHALTSHSRTQLMAHESDLGGYKTILASCKGLLADFEEDSGQGGTEIDGDELWREYDATSTSGGGREEKVEVLRKFLKRLIRLTLKMDRNEEIKDHVPFQDLGMDSLMMVEMKNGLQASVGKRVKISINAVKDCKTVAQLGDRLVELISGKEELPPPSAEELKALVAKDAALPPSIVVDSVLKATLVRPITAVKTVLVIGGTGTLGPYVIRELLARGHITRIVCLMQSNPMILPIDRFRRIYEKKGLLPSDKNMARIECFAGDIKEPLFGLAESVYRTLSEEVDAIFNLAVKVAFEEIYRGTEDPKSSRITNVFGMRNVLQFSVDGKKLKYVYHASTFAAETRVDETGHFWEDWPAEEEVARFPNSAYSISKLICDRLAEQAVERGVPCKVFRLPQLGGDSVKGGNVQMESFLMMRCLAYLYTGSMHGSSVPLSLMAVDQCAEISVELFFNDKAGYEMFNVLNPHLGDEREFETLAREFGVAVKVMESTAFLEKWNTMDSKDDMIQLVKFATSRDAMLLHLRDQEFPFYTAFLKGNKKMFYSQKLMKLISAKYPASIVPSWEVLRRDLKFARDSGVFERFKIKHSNPYLMTN